MADGLVRIPNPFVMNDWGMSRFLTVVFSIQIAVFGTIGLNLIDMGNSIVTFLTGFLYLTFVPGIVTLRAIRLHNLGTCVTLLLSVGVSLSILMIVGLLLNSLLPLIGIGNPISLYYMLAGMSAIVILMCTIAYYRDRDFPKMEYVDLSIALSFRSLAPFLVPLWTVAGVAVFDFRGENFILLLVLLVVSLSVFSVCLAKPPSGRNYSLLILCLSSSLLLHVSLVSPYTLGWDIQHEHYLASQVLTSGVWDPALPQNTNGMLSIVIIAPSYSLFCGISLVWVLKIVYPLLFSLVPLALFCVLRHQVDDRIAFLSCFLFVSIFAFYFDMTQLARQEIAELFLLLIVLLLCFKNAAWKTQRSFLLILFSFSLVVSHYGLSYYFALSAIVVWVSFLILFRHRAGLYLGMSRTYVLILVTFVFTWYLFISSGSSFAKFTILADTIATNFMKDFLSPGSSQGLVDLQSVPATTLHLMTKYMHLAVQALIFLGFLYLLPKRKTHALRREFVGFAAVSFVVLVAAIVVPYFAVSWNTSRLYQIAAIFLSPFFVLGGMGVQLAVTRLFMGRAVVLGKEVFYKSISSFLALFLLFNSGFLYEVAHDQPVSVSLNHELDYPRFNGQEVEGARWITYAADNKTLYGDAYRWLLLGSLDWFHAEPLPLNSSSDYGQSYLFLGSLNIAEQKVLYFNESGVSHFYRYDSTMHLVEDRNLVFDNGGANVYYEKTVFS